MTRCTSDLEYFMCDLCGVYFHKDIFCPHRRACKGPDSKEFKNEEVKQLVDDIDKEVHQKVMCMLPTATASSCSSAPRTFIPLAVHHSRFAASANNVTLDPKKGPAPVRSVKEMQALSKQAKAQIESELDTREFTSAAEKIAALRGTTTNSTKDQKQNEVDEKRIYEEFFGK